MRRLLFLFVLPIATATAGPPLLAARQPGARAAARTHGLRAYGTTSEWLLLEATPRASSALATDGVDFQPLPSRPGDWYLIYNDPGIHSAVLWDSTDNVSMVCMNPDEAAGAVQDGARLIALATRPYEVLTPPDRGVPFPVETDTFVQRLVGEVDPESIRVHIQKLQDFVTRYSPTESCRAAERWVVERFRAFGLDTAAVDSYPTGGGYWANAVGKLVGRARPEKVLIVCGHLDGTSEDPEDLAPGAEDNASGTAVAIEAARVLADEALDQTVVFIGFSGEEQGLYGSTHYAEMMRERGVDILGVVNFDMIAWPGGAWGVSLVGLPEAQRLLALQVRVKELYTGLAHRVSLRSFPSDARPFEERGYVATSGYEYGPEPYVWYHTTGDSIDHLDMDLAAEVTRMAVATLATLAVAPVPPEGVALGDVGNGSELVLSWESGTEPDLAGYKLLWGRDTARGYSDSAACGLVSSFRLTGLLEDTLYHATVVAVDSAGHESGWGEEATCRPTTMPRPPSGASAMPFRSGVRLCWRPNRELDLAGYNVYRTTVSGSGYHRLNGQVLADTAFRDSALLADTMYFYVATAVDSSGNESDHSAEVRSKPVTLDHGILLVDETRDGNGSPGNPSDEQQDGFYHRLVEGFRCRDWDVAELDVPTAADFGPFSTIVWHGDDYTRQQLGPALPGLANQLVHGGRLLLVGWQPVAALMGGNQYPFDFTAGQVPYDFFRLERAEQSFRVDFVGGRGVGGYPDVAVDSAKVLPALHGRLPYIDAFYTTQATPVLVFRSASGDSFEGKPVAVKYVPGRSATALLGFPLYYCEEEAAREMFRQLLEDLGEPYGVEEVLVTADTRWVRRLSANPSRAWARFGLRLAPGSRMRVAVYSVTGRLLRDDDVAGSSHGETILDLSRRPDGNPLPSGVYFLRVEGDSASTCVRFELVR